MFSPFALYSMIGVSGHCFLHCSMSIKAMSLPEILIQLLSLFCSQYLKKVGLFPLSHLYPFSSSSIINSS
ncbi:hypothetical protein BN193_09235 [Lactococcus raffinolactis 4877]|nr:hypothetical protein BN193_09235 [Lactococcus raffinolactis 4877]